MRDAGTTPMTQALKAYKQASDTAEDDCDRQKLLGERCKEKVNQMFSKEQIILKVLEEKLKQLGSFTIDLLQKNKRKKFLTENNKPDKISHAHAEEILPKSVTINTGEVSKRS